jgi:hypothetical protein
MKTHVIPIDRISAELEPHDGYFQVVNPFNPKFYLNVTKATVEFDRRESDPNRAVLSIALIGQRYRVMADGSHKPVGPGGGKDTRQQTVWDLPAGPAFRRADVMKLVRTVARESRDVAR